MTAVIAIGNEFFDSIEDELRTFQNKTLLTQDYRDKVEKWASASSFSRFFGGPTLEMERVLSINDQSSSFSELYASFESGVTPCPKSGKLEVILKHESTLDLPIAGVNVEVYEYNNFFPNRFITRAKTDEEGRVVFEKGIRRGVSYRVVVTDPDLEGNNRAMLLAYDELMVEMHTRLAARWAEYRPKWQLHPLSAGLLSALGDGLYEGMFGLWDDIKLAYNVVTHPEKYATKIYNEALRCKELLGEFDTENIARLLQSSKQTTSELLAFFNDEASLYLVMRSVVLHLRMFPWGELLAPLVETLGFYISDTLVGIVVGALLSLVAGGLGIAFLIYKIGKLLYKLGPALKKVWQLLKGLLTSTLELITGYFDKNREKNRTRHINSQLKQNKEVHLTSTQQHSLKDRAVQQHNETGTSPTGTANQSTACTAAQGCPVSMVTGEELLSLEDAQLPGVAPFSFTRQYRSSGVECPSVLGYGWSHSLQHQVRFSGDKLFWTDHENLTVTLPLPTTRLPTGINPLAEASAFLSRQEGEYLLISGSTGGWLLHVQREAGSEYGVVTGFSRQQQHLQLHYREGLPVRLENPHGAALHFAYQSFPQGERLTALTLERSVGGQRQAALPLMRYEYDERGQLSAAINAVGEAERYQYRADHLFTLRQFAGGLEFYWEWEGAGKQARAIHHWSNTPYLDQHYQWDDNSQTVTVRHQDGSEETYQHDRRSARLLKKVEPDGAVHEKQYGEQGELLLERGPQGQETHYRYNDDVQCVAKIDAQGQETYYRYSRGRKVEEIRFSPDKEEKLRERWRYDRQGNLLEATNALGQVTRYRWSESGALERVSYPDGSDERFVVDALGQVLEYRDRQRRTTWYHYDLAGRLIRHSQLGADETSPATQLYWDAVGRLEKVVTPEGRSRHYRYNAYGNVTQLTDEAGRITDYEYAAPLNLLTREVLPDGRILHYRYDNVHLQVSEIENERGEKYQLRYTPTGKLCEEIGFDGNLTRYSYDLDGQLAEKQEYGNDPSSPPLVTRYQYNALGQLTLKTLPDGVKEQYQYDDFGRLMELDDGQFPLGWRYDKAGKMISEHQRWANLYYMYDDQTGLLQSTVLPDGQELERLYKDGELRALTLDGEPLTAHDYDGLGREVQRRQANGLVNDYQYDVLGRLSRYQLADKGQPYEAPLPRWHQEYQYQADGELSQILGRDPRRFQYTQTGALSAVVYPPEPSMTGDRHSQPVETYQWDNTGNPLDEPSRHHAAGNRLAFYGDRHFEYDRFGNLITERRGTGQRLVTRYQYDCRHRLIKVVLPRGVTAEYAYDAFNRRMRKTVNGKVTEFFWQDNRLVAETDNEKHWRTFIYEPDSFRPLVMLEGSARRGDTIKPYWYQNDHLGTPYQLTDAQGRVVWESSYFAFGIAKHYYRSKELGRDNPLRFQGQYEDDETGFFYNLNRYYDPLLKRYLTQDPIGLAGGMNAYSYVSNPILWIDPLGLIPCAVSTKKANSMLDAGTDKVTVKSRSDAQQLFMDRYVGDGYKNMTGESGPSTKNLMEYLTGNKTKVGTYHWDDVMDPANVNRVMGHGPTNPDGALPHLQVHQLDGKVIHIFFPWGS